MSRYCMDLKAACEAALAGGMVADAKTFWEAAKEGGCHWTAQYSDSSFVVVPLTGPTGASGDPFLTVLALQEASKHPRPGVVWPDPPGPRWIVGGGIGVEVVPDPRFGEKIRDPF